MKWPIGIEEGRKIKWQKIFSTIHNRKYPYPKKVSTYQVQETYRILNRLHKKIKPPPHKINKNTKYTDWRKNIKCWKGKKSGNI